MPIFYDQVDSRTKNEAWTAQSPSRSVPEPFKFSSTIARGLVRANVVVSVCLERLLDIVDITKKTTKQQKTTTKQQKNNKKQQLHLPNIHQLLE